MGTPRHLNQPLSARPAESALARDELSLTDSQSRIATAPGSTRLFVQAGPGTGKTETVAHRLMSLIEEGLRPSELLVLSFSRNAVKTLATRIEKTRASTHFQLDALRYLSIRTFDSWTFRTLRRLGFQPADLLRRDYETNINELVTQLRTENSSRVKSLLSGIRHVIVDEFQDLSGVRGALVMELLRALAPAGTSTVGFTILGDPAQAIYGFALRDGDATYSALTSGALVETLQNEYGDCAETIELDQNFRSEGNLAGMVSSLRACLLRSGTVTGKYETMIQAAAEMPELGDELSPDVMLRDEIGSAAILTSTNGEAIRVTQKLVGKQDSPSPVPIRLHTRHQPIIVPPWIGYMLGPLRTSTLRRSQFDRIYRSCFGESGACQAKGARAPAPDSAWGALAHGTGNPSDSSSIDLRVIRERLTWPDLLPDDEGQRHAAIHVMTIHQSKGMEFDAVAIMADHLRNGEFESEAEQLEAANVIFVGMTRAAKRLFSIAEESTYGPLHSKKMRDGRRRWCSWHHGWVNLEMGIKGDVDASSSVNRVVFTSEEQTGSEGDVVDLQRFLAENARDLRGRKVQLVKWRLPNEERKFVYRIHLQNERRAGRILGAMTPQLTIDLLGLLSSKNYKLPSRIFNLRISDVVTKGSHLELAETIADGWSQSGLWLGVNLVGTGDFRPYKAR